MGMKKKKKKKKRTFSGVCISYFLTIGQNNEGLTQLSFFVCIPNRSESLERFLPKKKKERKDAKERERGNIY